MKNSFIKNETHGRCGYIHYYQNDKRVTLNWEMSGESNVCDILLLPLNLKEWSEPKGVKISKDEQYEILRDLDRLLVAKRIRSDVTLALEKYNKIEVENIPCIWAKCKQNRIKGMVYCMNHYEDGFFVK